MIPGVISYEMSQVTTLKVILDRKITTYEHCDLIIDENTQRTTIMLWNNTYSYTWRTKEFIPFLVRTFKNDSGYLYDKFADHSKYMNLIDTGEAVKNLKIILLKARRSHQISEIDAAETWDNLGNIYDEYITFEHFYDIYFEKFKTAIRNGIFSDVPWEDDIFKSAIDKHCLHFCEIVAPILSDVIKSVYQGKVGDF